MITINLLLGMELRLTNRIQLAWSGLKATLLSKAKSILYLEADFYWMMSSFETFVPICFSPERADKLGLRCAKQGQV